MSTKVGSNEYFYITNLQGDIIELVDTLGNTVAKYTYDAWGNHQVLDSLGNPTSFPDFIGNINPYRYRSYRYDRDTGLYCLNSRYYNPQIGRFISADSISYLDPSSETGLNLYAYCGNNPVMYIDRDGTSPEWLNPFTWNWNKVGEGVGLVLIGVGAVGTGIATLPFGGWIAVVAGITIVAGVGTTAFGASDIGEGITNYNVLRDTIFSGNQSSYDLTADIFKYTAIIGSLISGAYGVTHTRFINVRSTPRTSSPHSAIFNRQSNVLTYYGKNGEMKYSVGFFERGHQWIHWHTELPHSKPINSVIRFVWEVIRGGF